MSSNASWRERGFVIVLLATAVALVYLTLRTAYVAWHGLGEFPVPLAYLAGGWLLWFLAAFLSIARGYVTLWTWLRQSFAFSTSKESWRERAIALALLLALAAIGYLTWTGGVVARLEGRTITVPFRGIVGGWAVWALLTLVFLARGNVKLFGPVLFYDMVRSARRSRYILLRAGYCVMLLLILFFVWMTTAAHQLREEQIASRLAQDFFELFTVTQLLAVMLLTPAYVAGAISEEKDRKTLEFLLATDLRNREIVFSKYLSRLANLSLFLLTGLPILGMLQFLGGVDPNLVMASFAFTAITMIGIGGLSIFNSVVYKRPRDSISITYLLLLAYLGLSTALVQYHPPSILARGTPPVNLEEQLYEFVYSGNIFVLLAKVYQAGSRGALATSLPGLLLEYALFYGGIALLCLAWATLRLRRIALKQSFGKISRTLKAVGRAPVTELPMLWKEIHVEGSLKLNWMARIALALLVLATFANPFVYLVEDSLRWGFMGPVSGRNLPQEMNFWARIAGTLIASLTILGVGIRASNSISSERDRQTIDGLLTTPLDSSAILGAKFLGSLCSVRLGWVWLGLIYVLALITGGLNVFAFPLVVAAWFVYACAAAVIGMWYSMVSRSTMRATVLTVMTCAGLGVGHWLVTVLCLVPLLFLTGGGGEGGVYLLKFQAGMTPPAVLFFLSFQGMEFRADFGDARIMTEFIAFSMFGLFLTALATLFFWNGVLVPKFRVLTGRDEALDSESQPRQRRATPPPIPVEASGAEDGSGVRETVQQFGKHI